LRIRPCQQWNFRNRPLKWRRRGEDFTKPSIGFDRRHDLTFSGDQHRVVVFEIGMGRERRLRKGFGQQSDSRIFFWGRSPLALRESSRRIPVSGRIRASLKAAGMGYPRRAYGGVKVAFSRILGSSAPPGHKRRGAEDESMFFAVFSLTLIAAPKRASSRPGGSSAGLTGRGESPGGESMFSPVFPRLRF
jgi:hypothetical protein